MADKQVELMSLDDYPRPWGCIYDGDLGWIIHDANGGYVTKYEVHWPSERDNNMVPHIVRCVNAYDTLIEAIERQEKLLANRNRLEAGRELRFKKIRDYWVWIDDNGEPVKNELVSYSDWLIAKHSKELIQHFCDKLKMTAIFVEENHNENNNRTIKKEESL